MVIYDGPAVLRWVGGQAEVAAVLLVHDGGADATWGGIVDCPDGSASTEAMDSQAVAQPVLMIGSAIGVVLLETLGDNLLSVTGAGPAPF